jgi:hypothetical protein
MLTVMRATLFQDSLRLVVLAVLCATSIEAAPIGPPPQELVDALHLPSFYQKHLDMDGFPILASEKVSDYGMLEAEFLIRKMIGHRPDILRALTANHVRFVVMAPTEMTTDVPEHSHMKPKPYWDRRARGLGATKQCPVVSCGEENLLCLHGDPYRKENILIHEFAHAIHETGLSEVDPTFDGRLKAAFESAMKAGLWKGTYSTTNKQEYWAEGAQCWFNCAGSHDFEHGDIDTREKIKAYDPGLAALLAEVFTDGPWLYTRPTQRNAEERAHLAGFDVDKAAKFEWPKFPSLEAQAPALPWLEADKVPAVSAKSSKTTAILFINERPKPLEIDWVDFDGKHKPYTQLRSGAKHMMDTFSGHVWLVLEDGKPLGGVVATDSVGLATIK